MSILDSIGDIDIANAPAELVRAAWTTFLALRFPIGEDKTRWGSPGTVLTQFATADLGAEMNGVVRTWIQEHCRVGDNEWPALFVYARSDLAAALDDKTLTSLWTATQNLMQPQHTADHLGGQLAAVSYFMLGDSEQFARWAVAKSAGADERPARIIKDFLGVCRELSTQWVEDYDAPRYGADPRVHPSSNGAQAVIARMIIEHIESGDVERAKTTLTHVLDYCDAHDLHAATFAQYMAHFLTKADSPGAAAGRDDLLAMIERPRMRTLDSVARVLNAKAPWITAADKEHVFSLVEKDPTAVASLADYKHGSAGYILGWLYLDDRHPDIEPFKPRIRAFFESAAAGISSPASRRARAILDTKAAGGPHASIELASYDTCQTEARG